MKSPRSDASTGKSGNEINEAVAEREGKVRVQVDLEEGLVHELDQLMRDCRIETRKELINNALSIFQWAVQEAMLGRPVASFNAEEKYYNVLRMPALDAAAASGRKKQV